MAAVSPDALIARLVQQVCGREDPGLSKFCMRVLDSNLAPSAGPRDANTTADEARRRLLRTQGESAALRFDAAFQRFARLPRVTQKWSVMHLLLSLAGEEATPTGPTLFFKRTPAPAPAPAAPGPPEAPPRGPSEEDAAFRRHARPAADAPATRYEASEQVLLSGVVFALQGIESQYIRYDAATDAFAVDPKVGVPAATRDLVSSLCEAGWVFRRVAAEAESAAEDGLVAQSFRFALQEELGEYYRLLAVLEAQVGSPAKYGLTLRRVAVWVAEASASLRLLAAMVDATAGLRGGALASALHGFRAHGDPAVRALVKRVVTKATAPLFGMVREWVGAGELNDPFGEFFVRANAQEELLWRRKYEVCEAMRPAFVSRALADVVLLCGKSLNFLRSLGSSVENDEGLDAALGYLDLEQLQAAVEAVSARVSKRLLAALVRDHALLTHLRAVKAHLLLGRGDFAQALMRLVHGELEKPARDVLRHSLVGLLQDAVHSSSSQSEPADVLARLGVRLYEAQRGEKGWAVFSLDYAVDAPVSTVMPPEAMLAYQRLFHFLWRLKRVEFSLSRAWSEASAISRAVRVHDGMAGLLHKSHLVRSGMLHFSSNLMTYVMFEVLEVGWARLEAAVAAADDLDAVIAAHEAFIAEVMNKALLSDSHEAIMALVVELLDLCVRFSRAYSELCSSVRETLEGRRARDDGDWGTSYADEEPIQVAQRIVDALDRVAAQYRTNFLALVDALRGSAGGESLGFLAAKFDFNGYYASS